MITLNDLQRDFPEAYMKFRRANSISDDMLRNLNDYREQFLFTKRGTITKNVWDANQNKGMGEFDKSELNKVPKKV